MNDDDDDDDVRLISNDETSSSNNNAAIVNDDDVVGGLVEEVVVVDERVLWYNRTMRVFLSPIDMSDDDYHHYVKKINYISGFPILLLVDYNSSVLKLIGQEDSNVASIDLDLLVSMTKEKTVVSIHNNSDNNDDNNNDNNRKNDKNSIVQGDYVHVTYSYRRNGKPFHLNVFFSITNSDPNVLKDIEDSILELEFIFKQYTLWTFCDNNNSDTNNRKAHEDDRKPNNLARGFEKTGVLLREGLKAGGRSTGEAIRFLGKKYTENTLKWKSRQSVADDGRIKDDRDDGDNIIRSEPRLVEQDDIDKALRMKERGESVHAGVRTVTSTVLRPIRYLGERASKMATIKKDETDSRPVLDTVGGIGNAMASVFKGVTEAWSEIGSATSDAALYHSRHLHGNEYADAVTVHYVEGMGEIALGLYKGINVATLGVHGLVLDAVVEGTMLSMSLYEFLVGPVIIQDYMDIITLPSMKKKRAFLVLRPWSIAVYETASCFCKRPLKLIATSMLDTIPKLRKKEAYDTDAENNDPSLLDKLKGTETHIEICTVDCSTYLLFPSSLLLEKLFNELELACRRVETIDKRNSGALEIAVERRLSLMPKETFIKLSLLEVVLASNLEEDNQDIYELADKKNHIPAPVVDAEADISYLPLATDEVEVDRKTTPTASSTNLTSLADKISELKYNFFKSCEITILPLTHHGVGIVSEKVTSSSTKLEHEQLENDEKRYSASWDEEHILLGKNACLSPSELKLIQFSIYCESTVKTKVKAGTAKILLNKFSGTTENIWIDLKKKGKVEAKLKLGITIFGT